jgi:AcrR family transcriptional regulator
VEVILQATARVLIAEGFDGASTNRIAEVAGVSIGTLYQYFPSKEALLLALSERHSERMQAVFTQRFAQARLLPLRAAIRLIIQAELEALQVDLPLQRVLFEQMSRHGPTAHIEQVQQQVAAELRQALAQRSTELRVRNLDLATFVVLHALDGVCQAALRGHPELVGTDHFLSECTDLALGYLARLD